MLEYAKNELLPYWHELEGMIAFYPSAPPHLLHQSHLEFLQLLRQGELHALGFIAPRKPGANPDLVPKDCWEGFVDLANNEVIGNGLGFVGVRCSPRVHESTNQTKRVGRPSRKNQIIAAVQHLLETGQIDLEKPASHAYPLVRDQIRLDEKTSEERLTGLSDKTLEIYVNPLIKNHKFQP